MIENAVVDHPIVSAARKGNRYWIDFLSVIKDYKNVLNEQEYNNFLNKSRLDRKISVAQYLQFSAEVTVVDYIIRNYSEFINEPKYNEKKNPECSFNYKGRTVNIEVKCPDFTKRMKQECSEDIKIYAAERFPQKEDYYSVKRIIESNIKGGGGIQTVDRLDNKLKDYLKSAHGKFPPSSIHNFNILVIALETVRDMDEWYLYFFGENGAFTDKTYILEDYSNVDAVLLTNVQSGHRTSDAFPNTNCWQLESYISLLFLDPRKQDVFELGKYYSGIVADLFGGLTYDFLSFQCKLDYNNEIRNGMVKKVGLNKSQESILLNLNYMRDKILQIQIISEWIKNLDRKR